MPTQAQEIATLKEQVAELQMMLGTKFLGMSSDQLAAELKPENELPGGRYPYILSDFQLHTAIDSMQGAPVPPPVVIPPPVAAQLPGSAGGAGANPLVLASVSGVGIYFQSDTDNTNAQRPAGTTWPQFFGVALSGDGGGGMHQNVIWPEDGTEAWIPDPTRYAVSYRMDRPGMLSGDLYKAGVEFEPGKFRIVSLPGQLFVLMPDFQTGDLTIRLPQPGARLLVEQCATTWNDTTSRRPVLLGDDVGSPARGQL